MQKNNDKKVPQLRFPGFDGDWDVKMLGDLGNFIGGGTPSTTNESYWTGNTPWVSSSDVLKDKLSALNISKYITKEAIAESATKVIPANSLLLISRVGVGKLVVNTTPICTSQDFSNFIPTDCDVYFIGYYLLQNKGKLINFSQGTSIKGFTSSDIKKLKTVLPSLPEQQKIANFLSSIEKQISLLEQKTEQLEAFKKGTMQQLFSQKVRFKDENGEDFPDWEVKRLGQLIKKSFSGGTPSRKQTEYYTNGTIPWIKSGELNNIYIKSTGEYITELGLNNSSAKIAPKNTLLYALYGATAGVVGFTKIEAALNQAILAIIPKDFLSKYFLFHLLKHRKKNILSKLTQGGQPNLSATLVKSLKIPLPSLPEQKKIADCLSSIDKQIQDSRAQLEASKTYKKGLLQQLLV